VLLHNSHEAKTSERISSLKQKKGTIDT